MFCGKTSLIAASCMGTTTKWKDNIKMYLQEIGSEEVTVKREQF
jgi:hypothetical protein